MSYPKSKAYEDAMTGLKEVKAFLLGIRVTNRSGMNSDPRLETVLTHSVIAIENAIRVLDYACVDAVNAEAKEALKAAKRK